MASEQIRPLSPDEVEAFRRTRPGLRRGDDADPRQALEAAPESGPQCRRSHRLFASRPVARADLDGWLACLTDVPVGDEARRHYGSAGALYPVQTYLLVQPGRVERLEAGAYYLDPAVRALVQLRAGAVLDHEAYGLPLNRQLAHDAAFALFLIADLDAIEPVYAGRGRHFATLEAGAMTQLLEMRAAEHGLGVCQIGTVEFDRLRPSLRLKPSHELVHSLLGAALPTRRR